MNKHKALLPILLLTGILLMEGCIRTYPGNDMPSLKKPHKVLYGTWEVTNYLIDNVEVLDSLRAFYGPCWGQLGFIESPYYDSFRMYGDSCFLGGDWSAVDKSVYLRMGRVTADGTLIEPPATGLQYAIVMADTWSIYQLEKDKFEFHIEFQNTKQIMKAIKLSDQ